MKRSNRIAAAFVVVLLVIAMTAIPVLATPPSTPSLSGHSFTAYQIFTGTQAAGNSQLGLIDWGTGINGAGMLTALQNSSSFGSPNPFAACTTADDVAKVVSGWADNSAQAVAFSRLAYANRTTGIACSNGVEPTNPGYYLVVDTTPAADLPATDAFYNMVLLQLTKKGDFNISSKASVPQVEKKVYDVNDSDGSNAWADSADYDIGDHVPFRLTCTLGDLTYYSKYYVRFEDTLEAGLTYDGNATVTIDGTDVTTAFTVTHTGGVLTAYPTGEDVKALGAASNSTVVVNYTATLNTNCVVGAAGNKNEVRLRYSNNPMSAVPTESLGATPIDRVRVFTYQLVINKTDDAGAALNGAAFQLQKKVYDDVSGAYVYQNYGAQQGDSTTGSAGSVFTWSGLDDGDYKIIEKHTPAGYNTAADIEFTITGTHDGTSDDPQLTGLSASASSGIVAVTDAGTGALTGTLSGSIVNRAGIVLPETGGEGTHLIYILGAILFLGGGILLVVNRRMRGVK